MRTRQSVERQIANLRKQHTILFNSNEPNKWLKMQTVRDKIKTAWAQWHGIKEAGET